jgi:hypothetical protein
MSHAEEAEEAENRFIVDWVAPRASAGGELTTRNTLSHGGSAGHTKLSWRRRKRQPDSARQGAIRIFSGSPRVSRAPRDPPSGFT